MPFLLSIAMSARVKANATNKPALAGVKGLLVAQAEESTTIPFPLSSLQHYSENNTSSRVAPAAALAQSVNGG